MENPWRPIRCRCCVQTGRSASCWPRRFCRRAAPRRRVVTLGVALFSVVLKGPGDPNGELIANDQGNVTSRTASPDGAAPSMMRTVTFGGRDWSLGYYPKTNALK